jgi:hypothetical protein
MRTVIMIAVLTLFAVPALAVTYEWVDKQGTVNFTEDLGNVPKEYRKQVKIVGEEEDKSTAVSEDSSGEAKGGSQAKGKDKDTAQAAPEKEQKKSYGGKSADAWKREFADVNGKIRSEEEQLADLKDRMKDTSKMSRGEYLSIQMSINASESKLKSLRQKLDSLTSEADRAGVPSDLR